MSPRSFMSLTPRPALVTESLTFAWSTLVNTLDVSSGSGEGLRARRPLRPRLLFFLALAAALRRLRGWGRFKPLALRCAVWVSLTFFTRLYLDGEEGRGMAQGE